MRRRRLLGTIAVVLAGAGAMCVDPSVGLASSISAPVVMAGSATSAAGAPARHVVLRDRVLRMSVGFRSPTTRHAAATCTDEAFGVVIHKTSGSGSLQRGQRTVQVQLRSSLAPRVTRCTITIAGFSHPYVAAMRQITGPRPSCSPRSPERVALSNSQVVVTRFRGKAPDFMSEPPTIWRACRRATGRREAVAASMDVGGYGGDVADLRLRGRFLAWHTRHFDRGGPRAPTVDGYDARASRALPSISFPESAPPITITNLVVSDAGLRAWRAQASQVDSIQAAQATDQQALTIDIANPNTLTGPSIHGSTVRWTDNGQPHEQTIN